MSRKIPTVSIVMPVHNGAAYIRETLDSLFVQTFEDFEIIAVDDGSTDETADILGSVADPRLTLMRLSRPHGHGVARNLGMQWARGEFLCPHDADDLSHPERLAIQVEQLREAKHLVGVGSWAQLIGDEAGQVKSLEHPEAVRLGLLFDNCVVHASTMLRRQWLLDHHIEYPAVPFGPDWPYYQSITQAGGQLAILPLPLYHYRIHGNSISSTRHAEREIYVGTVRLATLERAGLNFTPAEAELVGRRRQLSLNPCAADMALLRSIARKAMTIKTSHRRFLRIVLGRFLVTLFERPAGLRAMQQLLAVLARIDARMALAYTASWVARR